MTMKTITPQELGALVQKGEKIDLVDVRTPVEFREVHAEMARNIPLDAFDPREVMSNRNGSSDKPLYVICRSGSRASKACEKLFAGGFENVINVEGGTQAWEAAGLPVKRGKKAMSLERQVRIATGFLVLIGVVLGFAVHPVCFGVVGLIGAGLMFSGITDSCVMGMLMAKMPWNQATECKTR